MFHPQLRKTKKGKQNLLTLCLDVCIGGLCIVLVSIPIQTGNCNRHEYEFGCLDVYRIGSRNRPEVSIQNRVWMSNTGIA